MNLLEIDETIEPIDISTIENSIIYRELEKTDIEKLHQLQLKLFPVKYTKSFYTELLDTSSNYTIVCINKKTNELVGVCSTRINEEFMTHCCSRTFYNVGYIMTLGVLPPYRRRGIASELLKESEITLQSKFKCKLLTLHCKVDNNSALSFYERHGFDNVNKVIGYYYINKKHEDAYQLQRTLDQKFFQNQNLFFRFCQLFFVSAWNCFENSFELFSRQFLNNRFINVYQEENQEKSI
eukprot:gene7469-11793_t